MNAATIQRMAADPREFRARLLIDTDVGPRPLGEAMAQDAWQCADFAALDNGWRAVARLPIDPEQPIYQRAWLERPRGHSKTADLAVMTTWALLASRRRLAGVAAAADRDQAKLLRDAIARLMALNPWLSTLLDCQNYRVVNQHSGSELQILPADVGSSYGLTPDFLILDEVTHWPRRELLDSLLSAAAKRASCMVVSIANAGFDAGTSWQWTTRETCRASANWYFSRLDGPLASWITPDRLAEQQRLLPPASYSRLWLNIWGTGEGDALSSIDIERAATLPGPMPRRLGGFDFFVGGLDLGLKRDHSALVVLAVSTAAQKTYLAHVESWAPPPSGAISIEQVKAGILAAHRRYRLDALVFDPWQAALLAEQLAHTIPVYPVPFTGQSLDTMARALLSAFRDKTVCLYRDEPLIRDLTRLSIVERAAGFRLTATRDEYGHCDRATAFVLALMAAQNWLAASANPVHLTQDKLDRNIQVVYT